MYLFSRFDVGGIGRVDGAGCIGVAKGIVIFDSYFQLFCDFSLGSFSRDLLGWVNIRTS
jgi:hypothetical protein